MRRAGDEKAVHQASSKVPSTRQNHSLWLSLASLLYCLFLCLNSGANTRDSPLSTGYHYHQTGISHMRSAQSARIATATVALFRQFTPISGFRSFSKRSNRSLSRQSRKTTSKSFSVQPNKFIGRKYTTQRYLSTSDETENQKRTNSSFAVPAMGTDTDNDGSIATTEYTGYEKWVRRLYATNMFHPVKLGLENMHLLHKLLGNPMDDVSTSDSSSF